MNVSCINILVRHFSPTNVSSAPEAGETPNTYLPLRAVGATANALYSSNINPQCHH